jgi:hypothetical protein
MMQAKYLLAIASVSYPHKIHGFAEPKQQINDYFNSKQSNH